MLPFGQQKNKLRLIYYLRNIIYLNKPFLKAKTIRNNKKRNAFTRFVI